MNDDNTPGPGQLMVLALLAAGAFFCGVEAILSDTVTTPAKIGSGQRVQGSDTVLVGTGWILAGLGFSAKLALAHRPAQLGTVIAVILCATGGLFWLAVI